jgi:hypothetical protein
MIKHLEGPNFQTYADDELYDDSDDGSSAEEFVIRSMKEGRMSVNCTNMNFHTFLYDIVRNNTKSRTEELAKQFLGFGTET